MPEPARIAVIGAGMAGLICAERLKAAGHRPVVFEKSRGTGGRLATRRGPHGGFDHGAQFVTARGEGFTARLAALTEAGAAAPWRPRGQDKAERDNWRTGRPGMSGLIKPIAAALDVRTGLRLAGARRDPSQGWELDFETGESEGGYDALLITAPAPQSAELARAAGAADLAPDGVVLAPCWAGMLVFDAPFHSGLDVLAADDDGLAFAAREASRPGRDAATERWVAHADPAWSREHLETAPEDVAPALFDLFRARFADSPAPAAMSAHRWRYAKVETALGEACIWDETRRIGFAGDWCLGPRVEAAFDSGAALAERVVRALA